MRRRDIYAGSGFLLVSLALAAAIWWAWRQYVTTPPYVDPDRYPVRGFDISSHNGLANLNAAADAGYRFVFIKSSEGNTYRDPNFVLNYQKARHAGLKVGAYHFFRFDRDGILQAENFLRSVGARPLDLGLVIDVEESGNPSGIPADTVRMRLQTMVEYLNMKGHRVTFYSNRSGHEKYLLPDFEGAPLWVCQFTDNSRNTDWTFWQYDHHGSVPGIRGDVDLNAFCGSAAQFDQYIP